jgi:hypothetical protein
MWRGRRSRPRRLVDTVEFTVTIGFTAAERRTVQDFSAV